MWAKCKCGKGLWKNTAFEFSSLRRDEQRPKKSDKPPTQEQKGLKKQHNRRYMTCKHTSVHDPSTAYPALWVVGMLQPIAAVVRRRRGFNLDKTPVHRRATTTVLEAPASLACVSVNCGRKPGDEPTPTAGEHANRDCTTLQNEI